MAAGMLVVGAEGVLACLVAAVVHWVSMECCILWARVVYY
jgi:hypothetical protein